MSLSPTCASATSSPAPSAAAEVPLFDPRRLLAPHRPALDAAFARVLDHGVFVLGPEVQAFEVALAAALGVGGAVGVSSGTDALLATFLALRLPPGAEILMTPFTFIASATSVLRAGLRPVLVDLPPRGLHPTVEEFERAWGPATAGVLAVHLFGEPVATGPLRALCDARGGVLVEDCAQAAGARAADGRSVGLAGRAGTLSFFPAKNLGGLGDGGAVFCDDPELLAALVRLRQHGRRARDRFDELSGNFRLDALHAALLAVLLPSLPAWVAARTERAQRYHAAFADLELSDALSRPPHVPGHGWNQYVVRSGRRAQLVAALDRAAVGHAIYYTVPLHRCGALAAAQPPASLPHAERAANEVLALPVYPGLTEREQARVIDVVVDALA